MNETQDQIAKLLDDKQKVEFQKMQDERRKGMQNRKPGNTPNSKAETQKKD
jgi:hypothetical protein